MDTNNSEKKLSVWYGDQILKAYVKSHDWFQSFSDDHRSL